jgi:hypothetical protein
MCPLCKGAGWALRYHPHAVIFRATLGRCECAAPARGQGEPKPPLEGPGYEGGGVSERAHAETINESEGRRTCIETSR